MIYLFILLLSLGNQDIMRINSTSLYPGKFMLQEAFDIKGESDGFYNDLRTVATPNGRIIIYDVGNYQMNIYSSKGKLLKQFGKQGNGPGEFSFVPYMFANDQYIYVHMINRFVVFDHNGKLIKEVTKHIGRGSNIVILEDRVSMFYSSAAVNKFTRVDYSLTGNLLNTYTNTKYNDNGLDRRQRMRAIMSDQYIKPHGLTKIPTGFARYYRGIYKLERLTENFQVTDILTRDYSRLKEINEPEFIQNIQKQSGSDIQAKKRISQIIKERQTTTSGYLDDIVGILGASDGYLFVLTSSNNKFEIHIDVISPINELVDIIHIKGDEFQDATISNKRLYVNYKNNDGLYVKVFNMLSK